MRKKKIVSFMDLDAWKEGHELVLMVYQVTKRFPKGETFGITAQIRRAVVSVTANIAEGFGRQYRREKIQFYFVAMGSVTEVQNFLIICRDVGYITRVECENLMEQAIKVHKIINGLIRSIRGGSR